MKELVADQISKISGVPKEKIINFIEIPPLNELGDFAFPCFSLAKEFKKNPIEIAKEISKKIDSSDFEKVESKGPYINFFLNKNKVISQSLFDILNKKDKFGSSKEGSGKMIVIDLSAPNIAKPFGIGHLRSTLIGNSISLIYSYLGYKTIKLYYLGDWGTQFGKLIAGYNRFGDDKKLKSDPIDHLQEIYVKVNSMPEMEDEARLEFKKLEDGDKKNLLLWRKFKDLSLKEFNKIYSLLRIKFDVVSGESFYNDKMDDVINLLSEKKLLEESDGAKIVNLEKFDLGVCLIKKSDGATLYATRDITAAIDRYKRYKFDKMIYEVGAEQKLHFKQFFKVLELAGFDWAKRCIHVAHGLYLDHDGKKFSTRKGKTIFMKDIINETIALSSNELLKREKLSDNELEKRARLIALSAIIYGDLKNYRESDAIFDIDKFISFEGNTGPYLLYTSARSNSILRKAKYKFEKDLKIKDSSQVEKSLVLSLAAFPQTVKHAANNHSPSIIANYAFDISQKFNEFYHNEQVIGSENEKQRLAIVKAFSIVLKNALSLLGIKTLEKM